MAKHLYLPVLVNANISEPERAGHWYAYDRKILLGIADGIVVDESARIRGVSSVPDPWARALMFRAAIRPGSRHPLRRRLLQEWRGMLSVLALYRLHGYPVEIVPVPLERRGRFAEALRRLKPNPVELERGRPYDWADVLMVRVNGVTVGALSPATLVFTGADYAEQLAGTGFPLVDGDGFLKPPETRDERVYLMHWLQALKTRLNGGILYREEENRHSAVIQDLNRLLNDWLGELAAETGLAEADAADATEIRVADAPAEPASETRLLERYRVYRELLRPLQWGERRDRHSELGLRMQRNRTPHQEVVIITPQLLLSDAKVWDTKRLPHLGGDVKTAMERHFSAASGTVIDREDISRHQAIWIRPERYFLTDTLLAPREGSAFLAADEGEMNAGRRYVMPFTRHILDFFTPEHIRDELRPTFRETDTEVVFSFSLPVGTRNPQRIERAYHKKSGPGEGGGVRAVDPPVLDLFPGYLGADWRRYYLFQAGAGELRAVPLTGNPAYVAAVRDHVDPATRTGVRLTQLVGDTVADAQGLRAASPFPEAVELVAAAGNQPAGLVLLGTGPEPAELSRSWRVGVDFGTSNTNVYRKDAEAENAERWAFHFPRYLRPLTAVPDAVRNPLLEQYFVPNRVVDLPIPTLLRIYQDTRREHMLLDYGLPFGWEYRLPPHVYTNLKWEDQDRRTEYFLECLFFLILVEVAASRVRTVDLACSYPKAFSMNSSSIFRGEVQRVLRGLLEEDGRAIGRATSGELRRTAVLGPAFEVEGVAAGEFFASKQTISDPKQLANKQIAAVCLDVGGGTTDVSIWSRNEIVFDASVQLAGRQISRLLQRNLPLLEKLFTEEAAAALYEKQNEPALFASRLNVVLRREEGRVADMLLKHATHPDVVWLRRMLALEFSALAFFSAALIGAAARTEQGGDLLADIAESGVKLHWGGNAAKLIKWIDFGRYDAEGIAAKLLNAMLFNGLRDAGAEVKSTQLGQLQSPGHKSEAAGGLVVMRLGRVAAAPRAGAEAERDEMDLSPTPAAAEATSAAKVSYENAVVCGENVTLEDRELRFMDPVGEKVLFSGGRTSFRRTSLERLGRFLEIFNHFGVRFGLLTDDSRIRLDDHAQFIRDRTRSELVEAASMPDGQRSVEPVLVSEVRLLMELLDADRR
jgi:hypothetical protein